MGGKVVIKPDPPHDELVRLSKMVLTEACKESGIGYDRLNRLFRKHGIEREKLRGGFQVGHKLSSRADKVLTHEYLESVKDMRTSEIAARTGFAETTVNVYIRKHGIDRSGVKQRYGDEYGNGVCAGSCYKCEHFEECTRRYQLDLPLVPELILEGEETW